MLLLPVATFATGIGYFTSIGALDLICSTILIGILIIIVLVVGDGKCFQ